MMSRALALHRIAGLYGVLEEMLSVALRQATATVHEVEEAILAQREASLDVAAAGRAALVAGEREDWLLAHAEGEIFAARAGMLEDLKVRRVAMEVAAREEFVASRVKTEQMKHVVEQMVERATIEAGRRTQAASDDRYASRRSWLASRCDGVTGMR